MIERGKVNGNMLGSEVTAIIQARMTSKRLPGKSLMPLAGKPLMAHVIERALAIEGVGKVVVATATGDENKPLIELAESMGVEYFVGSPTNVLERYYEAAEKFGGDYIIRITGDNPFTDSEYATMALEVGIESGCDLCSLSNLPIGTAVEVIKREALIDAYHMSSTPYQFEHVTPYLKEHSELFTIERYPVQVNNPFENLRLTVDTEPDFRLACIIYDALYKGKQFPLVQVINFLTEHPEHAAINSNIVQRDMTSFETEEE